MAGDASSRVTFWTGIVSDKSVLLPLRHFAAVAVFSGPFGRGGREQQSWARGVVPAPVVLSVSWRPV